MNKISKFSLLIVLAFAFACGGTAEQKTDKNKADSSETKVEGKSENKDSADKDKELNSSLIGLWEYESGEGAGLLDVGRLNFTTMKDFEGGAGMFAVEGTYSVKNGELIIQAKVTNGEDTLGRAFSEKFTILEINNKTPSKLSLKNSQGNTLVYKFERAYKD